MNQTQRNYIVSRVSKITLQKDIELRDKLVVRTPGVQLSASQKYDAIKKGEYKLKPKSTALNRGCISRFGLEVDNVFVFPAESEEKTDSKAYEKAAKKLYAAKRALVDEVMVGDNEQALKLLRAFEKKHGSVE